MKTTKLTEIAMLISLAVVIEVIFTGLGVFFPILQLPYGGRITLSMLPLFVIVYRHGMKQGIIAGVIYSILNLLLDGVLYHWASLFLDYLFAFGALGLSAIVFKFMKHDVAGFLVMIVVGVMLRFAFSYISGVVIFVWILDWMPEEFNNPWLYSLVYNMYYLLPSMGLTMLVGGLLFQRLDSIPLAE